MEGQFQFTVSTLVKSIRENLEYSFSDVSVVGEISRITIHSSGHAYFALKDENAVISAVMFSSSLSKLSFVPEKDMRVIVSGRISVYEKSGSMQIIAYSMEEEGEGILAAAFEKLKKKLASEGLFDEERKRTLPEYPSCVGVITSPTGAAIHDILSVSLRRDPSTDIILYPAVVQGEKAPHSVASMIKLANLHGKADVLIVGRGGGSLEDLWSFNEEEVARAIFESKIPVVSAVGHETDFSIADFTADMRAPTPSAAAEIVFPDKVSVYEFVLSAKRKMIYAIESRLSVIKETLRFTNGESLIRLVEYIHEKRAMRFDELHTRLYGVIENKLSDKSNVFALLLEKLSLLSPLNVLSRGYAIVSQENKRVLSAKSVEEGKRLNIRFKDGEVLCDVESVDTFE